MVSSLWVNWIQLVQSRLGEEAHEIPELPVQVSEDLRRRAQLQHRAVAAHRFTHLKRQILETGDHISGSRVESPNHGAFKRGGSNGFFNLYSPHRGLRHELFLGERAQLVDLLRRQHEAAVRVGLPQPRVQKLTQHLFMHRLVVVQVAFVKANFENQDITSLL